MLWSRSTAPLAQGTGASPAIPASCLRFRKSRYRSAAPSSRASFGPIPLSLTSTAARPSGASRTDFSVAAFSASISARSPGGSAVP